jgi:hypothetical protein
LNGKKYGDEITYLGPLCYGDITNMNRGWDETLLNPLSQHCWWSNPTKHHVVAYISHLIPINVVKLKQCHKPSPSHHHFYRWYKLTIPSHGWFMTLF